MGKHPNDPIGHIGAVGGQKPPALTVETQHRHLESRIQQMRPADVTRVQEKALEPALTDHIDIPFEHDPEQVGGGGASDTSEAGLGQSSQTFEDEAATVESADHDDSAPASEVQPSEAGAGRAAEHEAGRNAPTAPAVDRVPAASAPPPDMRAEMEQVRQAFTPVLTSAPTSVLGGNVSGLLTPNSGLPRGMDVQGVNPFAAPRDGFVGGGAPGWGTMGAAMFGLSALSAFTPFMFAMPFMSDPMSMGMMGGLGLMGNMLPLMSMMSLNMMMMQNMALTPPMMGCMPWACASMPYPFPMMNPYTAPSGSVPGAYGAPGGFGAPGGYGAPGAPAPGRVVSRVGTEGPPESTLREGGTSHVLGEAAAARLEALSPERRAAFQGLWNQYDGVEVTLPGRADKVSVNASLERLLESGRLESRDRDDRDLLDNLSRLASQPMAAPLDARLVTAQTIMHAADPAVTMTQGDRGTCAAATVEYMLARRNPSEYARIVSGLSSPEGAVTLASGRPANRVADSLPEDRSGRTAVNRLVQAAFMNSEAATSGDGAYSNVSDTFPSVGTPGWNPFRFFGQQSQEQGGLRPVQVQSLAIHTLGESYAEIFQEGQDPYAALPVIDRATRLSDSDGVPVSMQWDGGRHRVLVTGITEGRVYFRNPWGERTAANAGDRLFGTDHQVHEGGLESLSVNDFAARMKSAIVSTRVLS